MDHILVVDDEPVARIYLRDLLESHGFEVHEASDWPSCMRALGRAPIGTVILDVLMPGISGEKIAGLLARRHRESPPVLLYSCLEGAELERLGQRIGAAGWFGKGIPDEVLLAAVRRAHRGWKQAREEPHGAPPAASVPEPPAAARPGNSGVLVVDDDPEVALWARRVLEEGGFHVGGAEDWVELSGQLFSGHFQVVLLDVVLPVVQGVEIADMIRSLAGSAPAEIVYWSSKPMDELAVLARRTGVHDYLTKDGNADKLVATVRKARDRHLEKGPRRTT